MEHKFKISDTFADESKITRDAENRWFVECLEHSNYRTFAGRAAARAFVADGSALNFCEGEFLREIAVAVEDVVKDAKKPVTPKAPRAAKTSRFPGTFTVEDAANIVRLAKAVPVDAGESQFGSSRLWTVRIAGEFVAPKWIVAKLTNVPTSEFTTTDAVNFLAKLGLKAYKTEKN